MHLKLRVGVFSILLVSIIVSCSKGGDSTPTPVNECIGVSINVIGTFTDAATGRNDGSIVVASPAGAGYTYRLNNGVYQTSGSFTSLAPGNYTVTAKNAAGCEGSTSLTIGVRNTCAGTTISIATSTVSSAPCASPATGSITVTASGSPDLSYSIDGSLFQAGNTFANLSPGNYSVTVKNAEGCIQTASATVGTAAAGPKFAEVKAIIQGSCVGCHSGAGASAGLNMAVDCNIILNKDKIKTRAVDGAGTATQMPQPPASPLSVADRQKITDWINAGGTFSN